MVSFPNGVEDELDLMHYKMRKYSKEGCNYLGRLRNDPYSSVAVTGCVTKPGDNMEVTLLSQYNVNPMMTVDFFGNAKTLTSTFKKTGPFFNSIFIELFIISVLSRLHM